MTPQYQPYLHTPKPWKTVVPHLCLCKEGWSMSVQVQVLAQSIKMYPHTHTTVSVLSVEEQVNKSCTYTCITNSYFFLACVRYFLANYPLNFYSLAIYVLVCNTVNIFICSLVNTSFICKFRRTLLEFCYTLLPLRLSSLHNSNFAWDYQKRFHT